MKRFNIKAAFVGEPTASQEGLGADEDDDSEAVVLSVRGGEVTFVVGQGTADDSLAEAASVVRGSLRLEHERVLTFEIQGDAVGAFFEDEPTHLHDRREADSAVGMFSAAGSRTAPRVARDIMTAEVVSVPPEASPREVAELLAYHGISGLPVMRGRELLGIVSEADLIGKQGETVADIMTRDVLSVTESLPISEVANFLAERRIKRVPVLRDGMVVGLISRADLVRWLAGR